MCPGKEVELGTSMPTYTSTALPTSVRWLPMSNPMHLDNLPTYVPTYLGKQYLARAGGFFWFFSFE